jgi:hypothetical protein
MPTLRQHHTSGPSPLDNWRLLAPAVRFAAAGPLHLWYGSCPRGWIAPSDQDGRWLGDATLPSYHFDFLPKRARGPAPSGRTAGACVISVDRGPSLCPFATWRCKRGFLPAKPLQRVLSRVLDRLDSKPMFGTDAGWGFRSKPLRPCSSP